MQCKFNQPNFWQPPSRNPPSKRTNYKQRATFLSNIIALISSEQPLNYWRRSGQNQHRVQTHPVCSLNRTGTASSVCVWSWHNDNDVWVFLVLTLNLWNVLAHYSFPACMCVLVHFPFLLPSPLVPNPRLLIFPYITRGEMICVVVCPRAPYGVTFSQFPVLNFCHPGAQPPVACCYRWHCPISIEKIAFPFPVWC